MTGYVAILREEARDHDVTNTEETTTRTQDVITLRARANMRQTGVVITARQDCGHTGVIRERSTRVDYGVAMLRAKVQRDTLRSCQQARQQYASVAIHDCEERRRW